MSHVPNELAEEFPDKTKEMHDLKITNSHFAKLADQYHEVNREIHRIEVGAEAASDMRSEELRKQRLILKDEINAILADD